ncbi:hypothetical protein A2572_00895 [Candidatus Collierbacteria bacterium RIFOXYD1_FULL_40_9]|uniref:Uncharacterized protein n=1 Tax=Candidatus Collierbacteria bacterium RIFOXYD1_FULL_40_9 TaxID=1817731 RepID=A0A1F5FVW6_9BACT|nr:MAG: hypothetical protein A2572_00895 [Candidatus Collierbacteria bacterium RIFOXYD1_FULL_40_9]
MSLLSNIVTQVHSASVDVVGKIDVPTGVPSSLVSTTPFVSGLVKFIMVVGGLFTFWQLLIGGFQFVSSGGDKGKVAEGTQKIQMAITGLVIMTASFVIISIISKLLFGEFFFILAPKIETIK